MLPERYPSVTRASPDRYPNVTLASPERYPSVISPSKLPSIPAALRPALQTALARRRCTCHALPTCAAWWVPSQARLAAVLERGGGVGSDEYAWWLQVE